jgi:energy-coupling factor transport system ATP-binding protein
MKSKDIAIVGICLAVGAILRFAANMFPGAIVGNPVIALYCLAIILIRPKLKEAVGIGLVAAVVSMLISHSIFPPANLISEPLGALTCAVIYGIIGDGKKFEKITPLSPAITTFIATLVSGFSFIGVCMVVMLGSFIAVPTGTTMGFFAAVAPIVIITAIFNCIVTQILYIPAKRIISR